MPLKPKTEPRPLAPEAIVAAAIELIEHVGEADFSLRKLGQKLGCDPMTVLYHFKSKDGLLRAMADHLTAQLQASDPTLDWRGRLRALAFEYRRVALAFPCTFGLMSRFWTTGPADYQHIETVYQALEEAGFGDQDLAEVGIGWYATVIGLAAAEARGFLRVACDLEAREITQLPEPSFATVRRLVPAFRRLSSERSYRLMVEVVLDGLDSAATRRRAQPRATA
ncbi:transcriptional regulator, TetR family [Rhodopseudomonas palustris BisB5]|uniref:Transcriptional regulator, TetR family n=1 Tax=Rhodopseudomonas palustris (strain BisB5) TaxID=316057 RepID=Q135C8_RHOPS|nr:transcriptional regulator, TetR family [Rhodopseudomonas palustris BisB5]